MQLNVNRVIVPKLYKILLVVLLFFLILGITKIVFWSQSFMRATGLTPSTVFRLLVNTGMDLKSDEGRTNILLLGIGGGTHEGADLTDTILVVSLVPSTKKMAMISVPRDVWSETLKDKINSAYHYGEEKKKDGGLTLAKVIVEDMIGLPIHYVLLIDFSGFENIIDIVDGVDVTVPNAFTDPEFPIAGKENDLCGGDPLVRCRYESISFIAGSHHMDGETALTYIRSRHAEGDEGSDFARGRRQQEVIIAILEKFKKLQTWLPPSRTLAMIGAFDRATTTDMRIGELATLGKLSMKIGNKNTSRISFVDLLTEPPLWMYGRYTLVPKTSFSDIHEYISSQLE